MMSQNGAATGRLSTRDEMEAAELVELKRRARSGGNWFYWIVGLSGINTILALAGADLFFVIGLGITELFAYYSTAVGIITYVLAGAVLACFGVFATRGRTWAFFTGLALYGLDGLLFIMVGDWFSILFHILAIVGISRGLVANLKYNRILAETDRARVLAGTGRAG
jgi:hypothetical protein